MPRLAAWFEWAAADVVVAGFQSRSGVANSTGVASLRARLDFARRASIRGLAPHRSLRLLWSARSAGLHLGAAAGCDT